MSGCLLILIGLAVWPSAAPQLARLILGADADDAEFRGQVVEFARRATAGSP